jgi:hypothetical protein
MMAAAELHAPEPMAAAAECVVPAAVMATAEMHTTEAMTSAAEMAMAPAAEMTTAVTSTAVTSGSVTSGSVTSASAAFRQRRARITAATTRTAIPMRVFDMHRSLRQASSRSKRRRANPKVPCAGP